MVKFITAKACLGATLLGALSDSKDNQSDKNRINSDLADSLEEGYLQGTAFSEQRGVLHTDSRGSRLESCTIPVAVLAERYSIMSL